MHAATQSCRIKFPYGTPTGVGGKGGLGCPPYFHGNCATNDNHPATLPLKSSAFGSPVRKGEIEDYFYL
jgi:hypothetical protein